MVGVLEMWVGGWWFILGSCGEDAGGTRRRAGRGGKQDEAGGTSYQVCWRDEEMDLGGWAVGGALWVVLGKRRAG